MIKGIVITLLMMELLSETVVESKIPSELAAVESKISIVPTMPHNRQGQCLTEDMKIIEC